MTPTVDSGVAGTVIIITFIVIAALLFAVLISSTIRQQRRLLRTREHLGARLLNAQDSERASIARELHDDIVQKLTACSTALNTIGGDGLSAIEKKLIDATEELRNVARGMHPAVADNIGLGAALVPLCESMEGREGIAVEYSGPTEKDDLPSSHRLALYRVVQEGLVNIARHAGTNCATVQLMIESKRVRVVIADSGRGFNSRLADASTGLGVTSMRERMAILGGTLDITSKPGSGTQVTATLPYLQATS